MADNPFVSKKDTKAEQEKATELKQDAKDKQVEGAHAKAQVINSPSLDEQANQVTKAKPSGWEKPGSDLQEPTKVEGAVLTQDDVNKPQQMKSGKRPHYIAGKPYPVFWDDDKFDELEKKKQERLEYFKGDKTEIPEDDEYFKAEAEQKSLIDAALGKV